MSSVWDKVALCTEYTGLLPTGFIKYVGDIKSFVDVKHVMLELS